jgi:raffinose/stachyose/melibiose transport system permease protein
MIVIVFIYYPMLENIQAGFYSWSPLDVTKKFVGLRNYTRLFNDPIFFTSLKNNVLYAVISIICQVGGGLIIAAILENSIFKRFSAFLRTVYFIPVLISISSVGLLFNFVYEPRMGILNQLLNEIGLHQWSTGWLGNGKTAIYAIIAMSQWQSVGYITLLFIVAMQRIPTELYEAAKIDGASAIRTFLAVTVPQVKETTIVTSIITITGAFLVFTEVFVLTNGGPGNSTEVLGTYLFHSAFVNNNMGYASAIANIILVITIIISLIQMKLLKTGEE